METLVDLGSINLPTLVMLEINPNDKTKKLNKSIEELMFDKKPAKKMKYKRIKKK